MVGVEPGRISSTRTEINAHSPRYSTKSGRVTSKNAGAASIAVAIPALIAYFMSFSRNRAPNAQTDCPTRSTNDKSRRAGVCFVFGACGVILGNVTVLCAGSGRKNSAAAGRVSGEVLREGYGSRTDTLAEPAAALFTRRLAHPSYLALHVPPGTQQPTSFALYVADPTHGVDQRDHLLRKLLEREEEAEEDIRKRRRK